MNNDKLIIGGHEFESRFILGSGKYSMKLIEAAVKDAGAQIITLAVRRANTKEQENILDYIPENVTLLPNTSGARNAEEAVRIARLARELGCGDFVKIEIMRDSKYLLPDNEETIKATEILAKEGFFVMPQFAQRRRGCTCTKSQQNLSGQAAKLQSMLQKRQLVRKMRLSCRNLLQ